MSFLLMYFSSKGGRVLDGGVRSPYPIFLSTPDFLNTLIRMINAANAEYDVDNVSLRVASAEALPLMNFLMFWFAGECLKN